MRILQVSFMALALAACGQVQPASRSAPQASDEGASAEPATAASTAPLSTGLMGALSASVPEELGALTINSDGLAFANGEGEEVFLAATEFFRVTEPSALIAAGGHSFADAAPSATATRVELRRIVSAAPQALCGGAAATHVAIVSTEPLTGLHLMVFTGADAPGPTARDSAVCATYSYAVD